MPKYHGIPIIASAVAVCAGGWMSIDAAHAAPASPEASGAIEVVVVTAQKRAQSQQDVSISLAALTGEDLARSTVIDTTGLTFSAANVTIYDVGTNRVPHVNIRGIYSEPTNGGIEASVPVTIDGVLQGRAATIKNALYDIDRVEVLRGPQGDLYGANSIAGVVNIYTHEPNDDFGVRAQVIGGNFNLISTNGVLNAPISDKIYARLGVTYTHHDGYDKNISANGRAENENNMGVRLGLKFDLSKNADLILRAAATTDHNHGAGFDIRSNGVGFLPNMIGGYLDTGARDRRIYEDTLGTDNRSTQSTSATLNWRFDEVTLTSISAYQQFTALNYADIDYTNIPLLNTGVSEKQHQFSQELRIVSNGDGPFHYIAGLYYFNQSEHQRLFGDLGIGAAALGIPAFLLPIHSDADVGTVISDSYSIFGQAAYDVTSKFAIVFGARYDVVRKSLNFVQPANPIFGLPGLSAQPSFTNHQFSPQGTLEYHVTPDVMLYAKVARGNKSGGFNLSTNVTSSLTYQPEQLTDYEGGLKSEWLDHRLLFNVGIFKYDYVNLQVNQLVRLPSGLNIIEASNAARAKSQGFEIQLEAFPVPELHLSANYGYTDAYYSSFPNANAAGQDYTGNRLQDSPRNSASVSAEYNFGHTSLGAPYLRTEFQYRSKAYDTASNDPNTLLDPVRIANVRLGLVVDGGWEFALWGKNIFNEKYAVAIVRSPFFAQYAEALGPPATFGIDLSTRF